MAQLKIVLPINNDPKNRTVTDRPNPFAFDKGVEKVPVLLQPYIPRKDWIEFCDELTDVYKTARKGCLCLYCGFFALIPWAVWMSRESGEIVTSAWFEVMVTIGIVMSLFFTCSLWKLECRARNKIGEACEMLSSKLNTVRICYRSKRKLCYKFFHQLEVFVTTKAGTRNSTANQDPFFKHKLVSFRATFRPDDHLEVVGGTGLPAHHRSGGSKPHRTDGSTVPTEASSVITDDPAEAKAYFLEHRDTIKRAHADEECGINLAPMTDFVRSTLELHSSSSINTTNNDTQSNDESAKVPTA